MAQTLIDQGDFDAAIASYQNAVKLALLPATIGPARVSGLSIVPGESEFALTSDHPLLLNDFAWLLASCREARFRNAAKAVEWQRRRLNRRHKAGAIWNTLGVAHYRAGDWKAAVSAFDKSMELRKGGDAFDWFFLALAHHKLGHAEEAKKWYDKAVGWLEKNGSALTRIRQHATESSPLPRRGRKSVGIEEIIPERFPDSVSRSSTKTRTVL